jgi:hypothetical protein
MVPVTHDRIKVPGHGHARLLHREPQFPPRPGTRRPLPGITPTNSPSTAGRISSSVQVSNGWTHSAEAAEVDAGRAVGLAVLPTDVVNAADGWPVAD